MTEPALSRTPYLIHSYEHRAYPLMPDRPLSVGRDTSCDIAVNEVAVSRHHAEIKWEGDDFVLYPTGSTGTILNGVPLVAPQSLHEGDTFLVGTMKFVFTCGRLPVAMKIAGPAQRASTVEARRPTLTFPAQPAAPILPQERNISKPVIIGSIVAAVLALGGYILLAHR